MNNGTRIRTAIAIAFALYVAFLKTDVADFGNDTVNLIYQICMKLTTFVVIALVTYYNNDYTPEGAEGTGHTRQLKMQKKSGMDGLDLVITDYLEDGEEDE